MSYKFLGDADDAGPSATVGSEFTWADDYDFSGATCSSASEKVLA